MYEKMEKIWLRNVKYFDISWTVYFAGTNPY